jgi:hypothetical protein
MRFLLQKRIGSPWFDGNRLQSCQIFLSTTYQNGKNIPNNHEIYQMATKYTKWPQNTPKGPKIDQVANNVPTSFITSPLKIYPN